MTREVHHHHHHHHRRLRRKPRPRLRTRHHSTNIYKKGISVDDAVGLFILFVFILLALATCS